jgi:hypothetical protein
MITKKEFTDRLLAKAHHSANMNPMEQLKSFDEICETDEYINALPTNTLEKAVRAHARKRQSDKIKGISPPTNGYRKAGNNLFFKKSPFA